MRPVINKDGLKVFECLLPESIQAFFEVVSPIPVDNDNRYLNLGLQC